MTGAGLNRYLMSGPSKTGRQMQHIPFDLTAARLTVPSDVSVR
jgi:hypothetical protein